MMFMLDNGHSWEEDEIHSVGHILHIISWYPLKLLAIFGFIWFYRGKNSPFNHIQSKK